jgi:hypothetical protein
LTPAEIVSWFHSTKSTLGLVEIDAIKSSDDENEIGQNECQKYYSLQCRIKVIETVRPNGILIAPITPRGGAYQTSSIVQLDAWTWEDAIMKENSFCNFPSSYKKSGSWFEPGTIEENKLQNSKSYFLTNAKHIKYE